MTDKFSGLVCVLESDLREDDAASLIAAIQQLRGVEDVRPVTSRPGLEFVLAQRIKAALRERLLAALGETGRRGDMPVVNVSSLGAILALLVLVVCVVALILIVVGQAAVLPAWLVILLIGCVAAARLT